MLPVSAVRERAIPSRRNYYDKSRCLSLASSRRDTPASAIPLVSGTPWGRGALAAYRPAFKRFFRGPSRTGAVDASKLIDVRYASVPDPVPGAWLAAWLELLSADEVQRAGRFVAEADRSVFIASHALLRLSLSRLADVAPDRWTFETGPHGKPEIAGAEGSLGLRISLSHTRGCAACAVSNGGPVGVDVERSNRKPPLRISETCFAPAEREALAALPEADRGGRFFEHWTLKEAFLKAVGLGLTYPLERLCFSVGEPPQVVLPEDLGEVSEDWRFDSWLVGGEFRIGLAAKTVGTLCRVTLTDESLCLPRPTF